MPFDPEIPLVGMYPKNPETSIQKNICTSMWNLNKQNRNRLIKIENALTAVGEEGSWRG